MRSIIKFRYRQESSPQGSVLRPVASVILESSFQRLEALMYIDSGADITTIPFGAGIALGFKQNPTEKIWEMRGVSGGGVPYVIKTATLWFQKLPIKAKIAWALIEEVPFLMGRMDIFSKFNITFVEKKKLILFQPFDPRKNSGL